MSPAQRIPYFPPALALRPEPTLMGADHLSAVGAVFQIRGRRRLGHRPALCQLMSDFGSKQTLTPGLRERKGVVELEAVDIDRLVEAKPQIPILCRCEQAVAARPRHVTAIDGISRQLSCASWFGRLRYDVNRV